MTENDCKIVTDGPAQFRRATAAAAASSTAAATTTIGRTAQQSRCNAAHHLLMPMPVSLPHPSLRSSSCPSRPASSFQPPQHSALKRAWPQLSLTFQFRLCDGGDLQRHRGMQSLRATWATCLLKVEVLRKTMPRLCDGSVLQRHRGVHALSATWTSRVRMLNWQLAKSLSRSG